MFKSVLLTKVMFVVAFLWSEIKSIFIKTQKELGPYQRRIQGRGPGGPPPSPPRPLCLEQNEARTAGKFVFGPHPLLITRPGSATAYPAILTEQAWSINDLLHGQKEKVVGERPVGKDKSNQNTGFALPCPLAESAIYN